MTRGRAWVDERERMALEVAQLFDAAVLARHDLAAVGTLAGLFGDGDSERIHTCYLMGQDV
ncbi:hypothetical protein D3C85_1917990 [compost metagenome]